ncbi:HVO_A0556 family zinc finger protein [Salinarchaeum laminariae]|uniref:HVO_A0556 family zinc finger protein n=1 Tax=Salinarchaeum laminariae TaxID=869888 RepID=UPI0035BF1CDD
MGEMGDVARPERLLPRFEGQDCKFCDEGELVREQYKGSPAVVCDECDVPQIRFF